MTRLCTILRICHQKIDPRQKQLAFQKKKLLICMTLYAKAEHLFIVFILVDEAI